MSALFAEIPSYALGEVQHAACDLLSYALLTPRTGDGSPFRRARLHAPRLVAAFWQLTGWRVHDTRGAIRLERRPDRLDAVPWWPEAHAPDAPTLSMFTLVMSALERSDDQLLLSDLAELTRASAGRAGIAFDPEQARHRRRFCHAVQAAVHLGLVVVRDGHIDAWRDGRATAEALLDVERDALGLFFLPTASLQALESPADLLWREDLAASRDVVALRRRQRLARLLLTRPVVYLDDLDETDRSWLRNEGTRLAQDVERLTGGVVERRAEGLALVFRTVPSRGAQTFPSSSGESVAALALATHLAARAVDPGAPRESVTVPGDARMRPLPFVSDAELRDAASPHLVMMDDTLRSDLRTVDAFVRAGVTTLAMLDLVRPIPGGVAVLPAIARFRDVSWRRPRPSATPAVIQPMLFSAASEPE
jgi:uncharacterized protein (TIGR02678 family)